MSPSLAIAIKWRLSSSSPVSRFTISSLLILSTSELSRPVTRISRGMPAPISYSACSISINCLWSSSISSLSDIAAYSATVFSLIPSFTGVTLNIPAGITNSSSTDLAGKNSSFPVSRTIWLWAKASVSISTMLPHSWVSTPGIPPRVAYHEASSSISVSEIPTCLPS